MGHHARDRPLEVELKFIFPAGARPMLDRHPAFEASRATPPQTRQLVTTYFDTSDLALNQHGFTLRVRKSGDQYIQTLKAADTAEGLAFARGEWEWPVPTETPEAARLAGTPAGLVLRPGTNEVGLTDTKMLVPLFTTDISRTTRTLHLSGGTTVEVAIDEGNVQCSAAKEPVHELELELKDGPIGPLYHLALELHADLPLRIGVESKSARGYRLATGQPPDPVKARARPLDRHLGAADGCRQILGAALQDLLSNRQAATAGAAEGVHQMRIAVRRLRAAILLFEPHLEPHAFARFTDALRQLGRILGEARDWDVFCLETLPTALADPAGESWRALLEPEAGRTRAEAHECVADELARPAFSRLGLGLTAWIEDAAADPRSKAMQGKLAAIMPGALDRLAHKVAKRGRHIGRRSGPELHALRKSLKKLRYGVLSVRDLFPNHKVKPYLRHCKLLQKRLGQINDAAMAVRLVDQLSRHDRVDLVPALAAVAQWSTDRHQAALRKLPDAWAAFRGATPFWR